MSEVEEKELTELEKEEVRKRAEKRGKQSLVFHYVSSVIISVAAFAMIFALFLSLGNMRTMYVVSNSMVPTFTKGDLLLVTQKPNAIAVDDVIAYNADWAGDKLVTHRVVEVDGDTLTTQGDANNSSDPSFNKREVFGEIVTSFPKLGYLFNPYTIWTLVIVGILLSLVSDVLRPKPQRLISRRKLKLLKSKNEGKDNFEETEDIDKRGSEVDIKVDQEVISKDIEPSRAQD